MNKDEAMRVLSKAAYGCYLLTVNDGETMNGMPLSLFVQVSFTPPMVACGVASTRRTHGMIDKANRFAVVFLRDDQAGLVDRFKTKGDPAGKFEGIEWFEGETGAPILKDCLGYVECEYREAFTPGDHSMFVGEVVAAKLVSDGELLTVRDLGKHYGG